MKDTLLEDTTEYIRIMFNELYSGIEYPQINEKKVLFFVEKAINHYKTLDYYEKSKKNLYNIKMESLKNNPIK